MSSMDDQSWNRVPIEPQSVNAPLSTAAVFLVVTIAEGEDAAAHVRDVVSDLGGLVRTVGFRDLGGRLSCNVGIGREAWDRFGQSTRPAQLRVFSEVRGARHTAVSTPGDLLFHIRAERSDMCFELERLLLNALGDSVTVVDEVQGFRYFDSRDLLGFVDGTENPTGRSMLEASLIGDEDPGFAGGSYVVVQKYLHDLGAWGALSTSEQEAVIGRTKADNVELDDADPGADAGAGAGAGAGVVAAGASGGTVRKSHKSLNTIVDANGVERDILRDNMPFGRPGQGEFGTYFIGYSRDLWVIEHMLRNMFVGDPAGSHDRILDFSTAVTGTAFFVPSNEVLEGLAEG
ncbi:Dyp-type peroxidase [Compostimonas suwonensis]|uniref:Putative iron-dependent peroxidase n=1 Tax=Compostimonas suwonensis TaxID=1048394 RepID=A0A2M9BB22_9MICO|nr:Dyp-type peroxidase [Compostimonas suwonensis]PJJ55143.1 putative iron-dependent peroxidase [Compostimonas suwonensis]